MNNVARVFDHHSEFPRGVPSGNTPPEENLPWATTGQGVMPPMMFQLRFQDQRMASYAYSDLREIHCRDAGRIELFIYSMCKQVIIIEGRHLRELAEWFSAAGVRWVQESDPRSEQQEETSPQIVKIIVEHIPD